MYEHDNFKHHYGGSLISLCHYEFMIKMGLLMSKNQVKKSMSYVVSPHLPRLGDGALQVRSTSDGL